ncbi:AMP-binding protein [Rhodococcus qingshengii]|uniref:AMP-binding protein n=1 Tax=Rhodococcus qingshengii TaxID=334542 RepID=UPI001C5DC987|nr:AMP-binding protein [Rhodococcus qingshengii]MBW4818387.1 AMP-binding protein [Rhodococcus qingshengii]
MTVSPYQETHRRSLRDPEQFWADAAQNISWIKAPTTVLETTAGEPGYRWFSDGTVNTCFNALDRHVRAGRGAATALIYDSPVTGTTDSFTYSELLAHTETFAGALRSLGVGRGDRVLIYFPMIPQAVIAMLACARIGAIHVVVFGGFGSAELATRIDDARPKVIVAGSCGVEPKRVIEYKPLLDRALELATHTPQHCVIYQRPQATAELGPRDIEWEQLLASDDLEPADCVELKSTDPLYILYTSGTTGKPKGIVRDNGGHAVALQWSMKNIYDIGPGDVFFAGSDIGWVVGHSYIVYAPLLAGAATVLYEGKPVGTPDAGAFWRLVTDYKVNGLFTAPTAIRAIKRDDPDGEILRRYDLSSLRGLFLAGERLDPDTYEWLTQVLDVPIVDNWWQTETGWPIASCLLGLDPMPTKPGSATVPVPGYDVQILNSAGEPVPQGEEGAVCLKLPLPPGALATVFGDHDRFQRSYLSTYPGYYLTGDGGYFDADGYLFILGRTDDVMNVAGHRLSSGQIEAAVAEHPGVAECAVIGAHDDLKGQVPRALIVPTTDYADRLTVLPKELADLVRSKVGAIASLASVDIVPGLPKTRSGKIVRRTLRQIVDGQTPDIPSTIENPGVIDEIAQVVRTNS